MLKRSCDILFSLLGLILLSPVFFLTGVLIKLGGKGPLFYRGVRVGRHGRMFRMFKFRTMVVNADKIGGTSSGDDDPRITKIGVFLRRYKFDEIPQLINILKGEMSFVGPRPQVSWAVKLYSDDERGALLSVRPGITDYASIRFNNEGEILKGSLDPDKDYIEKIHPEKMRLGMKYVKDASFMTDVRILADTFMIFIKRKGQG